MADYRNTSVWTLYNSCVNAATHYWSNEQTSLAERARAWVEAENIYAVFQVICRWFDMLETGEAYHRYPDPYWNDIEGKRPVSQEYADQLIKELDEDFMLEKSRFRGRAAPEFSRLPPYARLAFAQELWRVIMTQEQIKAEAQRRIAEGQTQFPPPRPKEPAPG